MIEVSVSDPMHFVVTVVECGCGWVGMRHTDDVGIIMDRAIEHDHPMREHECDDPAAHAEGAHDV